MCFAGNAPCAMAQQSIRAAQRSNAKAAQRKTD